MTMSYNETKSLIDFVLKHSKEDARSALNAFLIERNRTEPEFCAGVIAHGSRMNYGAEQWFDFFLKVPNRLFQDEFGLMNKLSEKQRVQLQFE